MDFDSLESIPATGHQKTWITTVVSRMCGVKFPGRSIVGDPSFQEQAENKDLPSR